MPRYLFIALLLMITAIPIVARGQGAHGRIEVMPGQVIVRWKLPETVRMTPLTRVAGYRAQRIRNLDAHTELLHLDTPTEAASWTAVAALKNDPRVASVEPNIIRHTFVKPNDTYYALQWHLPRIHAEEAWDVTQGGNITVAVIDTGIRGKHPDLQGQLLPGYDFVTNTATAGDGDGRDADPTDMGTNDASSTGFHGTHIAGIIAARPNNGVGVAGVCWNCKIVPIRVLGIDQGKGADADIADGIRWAAGLTVAGVPNNPNKAQIINMSFGGDGASTLLTQAIHDAMAADVIIVAAAGNDKLDAKNIFPAAVPGVVTVGAAGYNRNKLAPYSNYGSVINVLAPGGDMTDTLPQQCQGKPCTAGIISTMFYTSGSSYGYHLYEGTSQAAPVVTGVVALMLSLNSTLTSTKVIDALEATADASYTCSKGCGAGLVNAAAAVKKVKAERPPPPKDGLLFGSPCTDDQSCASHVCRRLLSSTTSICTRVCSSEIPCPTGSDCRSGFCAPSMDPNSNTPTGDGPVVIRGVACHLGPESTSSLPPLSSFVILILLGARSRRRR